MATHNDNEDRDYEMGSVPRKQDRCIVGVGSPRVSRWLLGLSRDSGGAASTERRKGGARQVECLTGREEAEDAPVSDKITLLIRTIQSMQ